MAEKIDLTSSKVQERQRQAGTYGTQTPLSSAAVDRGTTRWLNGSTVVVDGLLDVAGTLTASGAIAFSGQTNITGPLAVAGETTVTGPTHLNGATDIAGDTTVTGTLTTNGPLHVNGATDISGNLDVDGTLDINGAATLRNDLTITGAGKIKAGVTQLNPDGTLSMGSGKRITPDNGTGSFAVESGAASMQLTPSNADYHAQFSGGGYFQGLIRGMGLKLASLPTTAQPANLYIDGSGNVFRSTAA